MDMTMMNGALQTYNKVLKLEVSRLPERCQALACAVLEGKLEFS
jgi:hypothetical protein